MDPDKCKCEPSRYHLDHVESVARSILADVPESSVANRAYTKLQQSSSVIWSQLVCDVSMSLNGH